MTKWLSLIAATFAIALVAGCGGGDTDTAKSGGTGGAGTAVINNNDPRAASAPAAPTGPSPAQEAARVRAERAGVPYNKLTGAKPAGAK